MNRSYMEELLAIKNLSVTFKRFQDTTKQVIGVREVNLSLKEGEVLAVVGASGSGKSLLAHAVMGILPYNAIMTGEIYYQDHILTPDKIEELRGRELALIPQSVSFLNPLMRIGKQVLGLYGSHHAWQQVKRKLGLEDAVDRLYPFQLSGGMARRILVATATVSGARCIIADEPTPGMDLVSAKETLGILKDIARSGGGVLLITHDLDLALEVADRIAVFKGSTVIDTISTEVLRQDKREPEHAYIWALYDALPQNLFMEEPVYVESREGNLPSAK